MPSYKVMVERNDGWCDWVYPKMKGYRMQCCDCGLVHELHFKVVRVTSRNKRQEDRVCTPEKGRYRIFFRAKRNNRSTANVRRKKRKCSPSPIA